MRFYRSRAFWISSWITKIRNLLWNRFRLLDSFCWRLIQHSPSPITLDMARVLKYPTISVKNLVSMPTALISQWAFALYTYATYKPRYSPSVTALDSQFLLIMDKRRAIIEIKTQDCLKKNSQIQPMKVPFSRWRSRWYDWSAFGMFLLRRSIRSRINLLLQCRLCNPGISGGSASLF